MTPEQNVLTFYLNILEVSGKKIVNTYVNDIHRHLDTRGLKHTVDIVTDEDFYVNNTITGGGTSTFPYVHFEAALNGMRDVIPFTGNNPSESTAPIPATNYDDETVMTETKEDVENKLSSDTDTDTENTLTTRMLAYNPLELDGTTNSKHTQSKSKQIMLDIPDNYTGIIHILLTINMKPSSGFISGGITQLNQFLETYKKKGD
jgi:hypothetical protein